MTAATPTTAPAPRRKREQVVPYFAGFVFEGDPEKALAGTLDRLVRHVMRNEAGQADPTSDGAR